MKNSWKNYKRESCGSVKGIWLECFERQIYDFVNQNSLSLLRTVISKRANSVTRFGDLLEFGQHFKAIGNN